MIIIFKQDVLFAIERAVEKSRDCTKKRKPFYDGYIAAAKYCLYKEKDRVINLDENKIEEISNGIKKIANKRSEKAKTFMSGMEEFFAELRDASHNI